ncbi:hypothetical protein [Paenibacillus dendritiformis]|uniref:hypothetical protein n=1 Tax=Paenibacillus dendritiformis TaxID=130049 RepID=UPI00387E0FC1
MKDKRIKYHIDNYFKDTVETVECAVDADNIFSYKNKLYIIDKKLKSYKVHNKPKKLSNGDWNNWTNECEMDCVHVAEVDSKVHFFDQYFYRLHPSLVTEV